MLLHRPVIEIDDQLPDDVIEFGKREEMAVSLPGRHPTLNDLYVDFDLCLVVGAPSAPTTIYARRISSVAPLMTSIVCSA
jgi:hypothetical protein